MDEQKLKDIEAPKKGEYTAKQKRRNTIVFMFIGALLNLALTFGLGIAIMFLCWTVINRMGFTVSTKEGLVTPVMWFAVIVAVLTIWNLQRFAFGLIIRKFKMQDKLDKDFVDRYAAEKTK